LPDPGEDALAFAVPVCPVADLHLGEQARALGIFGVRPDRQQLVVGRVRVGVPVLRRQDRCATAPGVCHLPVEGEGFVVGRKRLVAVALRRQDVAEAEPGLRPRGLEGERFVGRGAGIVVAPQREARDGAAEPGLGIASRQRQGLVVGGERLLVAGEVVEGGGATSQRLGVVRFERQGLVAMGERFARAPGVAQNDAVIGEGDGAVRVERERPQVALGRLLRVAHRELDAAEIGMSLRRARLHLDRAGDEAHRLGVIAAPALEDAEHVQRVELLLVRRQHLIEQQFGLAEGSGAVGGHRTLQDLVHFHGGSWSCATSCAAIANPSGGAPRRCRSCIVAKAASMPRQKRPASNSAWVSR